MKKSATTPLSSSGKRPAAKVTQKQFVLDTNVLIFDPQAIFRFDDNHVHIPVGVLEELDGIKTEQDSERGRNAREAHRILLELFPDEAAMRQGVHLPSGGTAAIFIPSADQDIENRVSVRAVLRDKNKKDNHIILAALSVAGACTPPTILVTRDANVALKARALGLKAEDYRNDKVKAEDAKAYEETEVIDVPAKDFQCFSSEGGAEIEGPAIPLNTYMLVRSDGGPVLPARAGASNVVKRLHGPDHIHVPNGRTLRPRNLEQTFLMDALFDTSIRLITVRGQAGTGKTLITMAACLAQVIGADAHYDRVLISRAVQALGKDMGFLPGDLSEKMAPWLQPYFDALDFLFTQKKEVGKQFEGKKTSNRKNQQTPAPAHPHGNGVQARKPYDSLIASGVVQIEALAYIRGRSIPGALMIVDEVQNLTKHEVKTIITRMSEGSKLILMGDEHQIDNVYLDRYSNGLIHAATRMRGQHFAAHINLTKGERSELAEAGAKLL